MNAERERHVIDDATCAELKNLLAMVNHEIAHRCMVCEDRKQLACPIYNPGRRCGDRAVEKTASVTHTQPKIHK